MLSTHQMRVLVAVVLFFYYIQLWGLVYTVIEGWDLRVAIEFIVVTCVNTDAHALLRMHTQRALPASRSYHAL